MGAFFVDPSYPMEQFEADADALQDGHLRLVEAWPGSVTTEVHEWPDGRLQYLIDGVATRILGRMPDEVIAVGLWLVPADGVAEYRATAVRQ